MTQSSIVTADPQYNVVRILRPQDGFETLYQGQAREIPLGFYPSGKPLDPAAGDEGYDSRLIRALKTSPGQTMQIWLPNMSFVESTGPTVIRGYEWVIGWRFRNLLDFRTQRTPYHLARGQGPNDTSGAAAEARVVIPAAWHTLLYNEDKAAPAAAPEASRVQAQIRALDIKASAVNVRSPLVAAGIDGVYQQGVQDPAVVATSILPGFLRLEVKASADEMFLVLRRTTGPANWAFAAGEADFELSRLLGNGTGEVFPDVGVYVIRGNDSGLPGVKSTDRD